MTNQHKIDKLRAEYNDLNIQQNGIKLCANSFFGKTSNKYSKLYSPITLLHTVNTGQLTIMMYMEQILEKIPSADIFYSNTDSVMLKIKKKDEKKLIKLVSKLDKKSKLIMEYDYYDTIAIRDVNNYVGVYTNGKIKAKGAYSEDSLMKNKNVSICYEAVREYIKSGTPLKTTIDSCKDMNKFIVGRNVTGGAMLGGEPILGEKKAVVGTTGKTTMRKNVLGFTDDSEYAGKVVRFYFANDGDVMWYKKTANKVPLTESGVKSLLDMPQELPTDINYEWYYNFAQEALNDLGN